MRGLQGTGTSRGMNAALFADTPQSHLPHTSRRQLIIAIVVTLAAIAGAIVVYVYYVASPHSFPGTIQEHNAGRLNFPTSGLVSEIDVTPGEPVKAGQVLARQDAAVAQTNLTAAQSVLTQAQSKLAFLRAPSLSTAQARQASLAVAQAQSKLSGDQTAAQNAQSALSTTTATTVAAVSSASSALSTDRSQFSKACPTGVGQPPPPGAPAGSVQIYLNCQSLSAQVGKDQSALNSAIANQSAVIQTARQQLDQANGAAANDEAALVSAQNQASAESAQMSSPTAIADAMSAVVQAKQQVSVATSSLAQLTLAAPSDGIVADVAGVTGEYADSSGVHYYPGPQSQTSTSTPGYSLFPLPSTSGSNGTTSALYPMVTFYPSNQMQIVAEVPEDSITSMTQGKVVHFEVTALSLKLPGTVSYVIPIPLRGSSGVAYQVVIACPQLTSQVLPGMSVSVTS